MPYEVITLRYVIHRAAGLVIAKDGSWSLTKTAASTFHLLLAGSVMWATIDKGFDLAIWGFYAACAIGHAAYDKTKAQTKDLEEKKLEADK